MRYKKNSPEYLRKMGDKILEAAQKKDDDSNFYFVTTFRRYQKQLDILYKLEAEIEQLDSLMVEKTYSQDKKNLYTHPAITEYTRTCTAANQTAQTLIKIINDMMKRDDDEIDEFAEFMNRD